MKRKIYANSSKNVKNVSTFFSKSEVVLKSSPSFDQKRRKFCPGIALLVRREVGGREGLTHRVHIEVEIKYVRV
jgi:hypothetical protein